MFERALAIWERVLGPDHPDTAVSLNNLGGLLYSSRGSTRRARPLYERALAIRERVLGPGPSRYRNEPQQPGGAAGVGRGSTRRRGRCMSGRWPSGSGCWGPDHPHTAVSLNNLAELLAGAGGVRGGAAVV